MSSPDPWKAHYESIKFLDLERAAAIQDLEELQELVEKWCSGAAKPSALCRRIAETNGEASGGLLRDELEATEDVPSTGHALYVSADEVCKALSVGQMYATEDYLEPLQHDIQQFLDFYAGSGGLTTVLVWLSRYRQMHLGSDPIWDNPLSNQLPFSVHVVASLGDGASCLLPEVVPRLAERLGTEPGKRWVHAHVILPECRQDTVRRAAGSSMMLPRCLGASLRVSPNPRRETWFGASSGAHLSEHRGHWPNRAAYSCVWQPVSCRIRCPLGVLSTRNRRLGNVSALGFSGATGATAERLYRRAGTLRSH
jgi:hypothetical protein